MKAIRKKLSSNSGASITFALLLFLVCAVIGSVILTAGTAAAGRLSKMTEMDQRYYSVTSAAALLRDMIDNQSISVVETVTGGSSDAGSGTPTTTRKILFDGAPVSAAESVLADAADRLCADPAPQSPFTRDLVLSVKDSEEFSMDDKTAGGLTVQVRETLSPDGTLTLDVGSGSDPDQKDSYRLRLTFSAVKEQQVDTRMYTDTVTTTTTWTWTLTGIETL